MLFYPKQTESQAGQLIVQIREAKVFIKKWLGTDPEFTELSMRWAAGRDMQGALLVMAVRHAGRGFDVAFRRDTWQNLGAEPQMLTVRYQDTAAIGSGADSEWAELDIDIPDGSFSEFIAGCRQQAAEDPGKQVIGEIAEFFAAF